MLIYTIDKADVRVSIVSRSFHLAGTLPGCPVFHYCAGLGGDPGPGTDTFPACGQCMSLLFYHLRQIRSVRRSLTFKAARSLMHAFICSRVDYCSAIYAGVEVAHVDQLQSVLNAAARLIGGIPKSGHISEFIRAELHWLPMHRRIAFKILMLIRNCLAGQAPVYLRELCVPVSSLPGRRSLRSAEQGDLVVPRVRLATVQCRSFAVVGPSFWNALPSRLHSELLALSLPLFRSRLKTIPFDHGLVLFGRECL